MVVHDEETLEEALLLSSPVRYSDVYMYVVITSRDTLETRCRAALERGDIAIVVPCGMESTMEDHEAELKKVKAQRRVDEQKAMREYMREHPERVEKVVARVKARKGKTE